MVYLQYLVLTEFVPQHQHQLLLHLLHLLASSQDHLAGMLVHLLALREQLLPEAAVTPLDVHLFTHLLRQPTVHNFNYEDDFSLVEGF